MSNVLQDLGNLHIFAARVDADGDGMTSNDGSASVAANGATAGDFTITFGQAWLNAPTVLATALDPTYTGVTDGVFNANVESVTTTALTIQVAKGGDAGADGAEVDAICHVIAIGTRNN